ncbi:MAG: galactose oxidase-like domain-containing protein [Gaiellaceae bacterium]|jgi:plastocyanin
MATRDVYLKIEPIYGYSTVEPDMMAGPPRKYRRDCMRNAGHEDTSIPATEVDARRLNALIYREYLDPGYLIPKTDKIVLADVNEPVYHRRVPGTVIYAHPGDRLQVHVLNWDSAPHSFHVHGLVYGLAGDGTWPFGIEATDGRRSDEICPGSNWTYIYDVTNESLGAWPFHDHCHDIGANINRGLFGGIVVLPRRMRPPVGITLPPIVHEFVGERAKLAERPMPMRGNAAAKDPSVPMAMAASPMPMPIGAGGGPAEAMPMDVFPDDFEAASILHFLNEWLQDPGIHPPSKPNEPLHVPLFFHFMSGAGVPAFNSGSLAPGAAPFTVTFGAEGVFPYHCEFHPTMRGKVTVAMGGPSDAFVTIQPAMLFDPAEVTVAPGGTVHWSQASALTHTVTEDGGGLPSYCFNGRSFVGNTPTIVAEAGRRIRWYVFNLDVGMMWHNFHPHAQRWTFAGETIDVRSIGPAESFVLETVAPPPLLLPPEIADNQNPKDRPRGAKPYRLRADFPFHCHVEMHMMQGLVGLVRSTQTVWLTPRQAKELESTIGLPLDPGGNECPRVDFGRCAAAACGTWEEVAGLPEVTMMHAALLPQTEKVLYWGHGELGGLVPNQSRIWDYSVPPGAYSMPANQPHDVAANPGDRFTWDIWSAEHAFLDTPEGKLLVHGGFAYRHAFIFDPSTLSWSATGSTSEDRFYSTSLTLADGKVLTLFGNGPTTAVARSIEVYDPGTGTWSAPKTLPAGPPNAPPGSFNYLFYPWTYLLPGGDLFIGGHQATTVRFDWTATPIVIDPAKVWTTIAGERSTGGEKGTSVLLPLRPPGYEPRVLTAGGDPLPAQQTSELIDLSLATPAWTSLPNLNQARDNQVNSVLLPDGRVLVVGGVAVGPDGGPAELFDPEHPEAGWERCAPMKYKRGYHSAAILLMDGSVLVGGDPPGTWGAGGSTPNERYFPSYYFQPRPAITGSPALVNYGSTFTISSPNAPSINEVVLLRPGAVTHGFNMSQRFVGCEITGGGPTSVQAKAPPDADTAPPGWYLLFIVDSARVPSVAAWIRLTP